jgi:hypothetical protein
MLSHAAQTHCEILDAFFLSGGSTLTSRPRRLSHHPPRHLARLVAATAATVGTRTRTRTTTAAVAVAVATTARTATAMVAEIALLARPPPPLPLTAEPVYRGQPMATHGRDTLPSTPVPGPLDSSVRMPSWPLRVPTHHPVSCPASSSSSRCVTRPALLPHQAGTPGSAWAGSSSHWRTPLTPWHSTHLQVWSRTG